ncbi:MAG TPA: sugar phosphate nucleotidyltransferase, partial [Chloroflexota bacterium]|nr:sugar phosphate nucleotidyltransferase [Chloroflexota bacterium]
YVERGEELTGVGGFPVYRVARFVEKPNRELAEVFVSAGTYSWNSGMFVWPVSLIRQEFERYMPALFDGLSSIGAAMSRSDARKIFLQTWPTLPKQTIDYGVMEKSDRVVVVPVDIGWNDVGSWGAVYEVSDKDEHGNVLVGRHLAIDTIRSLVYSPDRLIATVGISDLVIVDTGDVLLICPRERAQGVRQLVAILQARGETDLL